MPTGMVGWSGRGRDKPSPKWATGRRTGPVPNGLFAEDPEKLTGSPREVTRGLSVFSVSLLVARCRARAGAQSREATALGVTFILGT
jgi:hypothetical protein